MGWINEAEDMAMQKWEEEAKRLDLSYWSCWLRKWELIKKEMKKNLDVGMEKEPKRYQTYLKDCDCQYGGILLHNNVACCRWCRKPYAKGGEMYYEDEMFKSEHSQQYPKGIKLFEYPADSVPPYMLSKNIDTPQKYQQWVKDSLEMGATIHSVTNSTGETLSVGTETNYGKLEFINIYCGRLATMFSENSGLVNKWIDDIHPAKPVFRTDGLIDVKLSQADYLKLLSLLGY